MDDPHSLDFLVLFFRSESFTVVDDYRLTGFPNARVATRGAQVFRPGERGQPYVLLQTVRGISFEAE